MGKQGFITKRNKLIKKLSKEIELNIKMDEISDDDIQGYYIMNRMEVGPKFKLPMIGNFGDSYPNYISLVNHPKEFEVTNDTCVAFYTKDINFDTIVGLYIAIIYKDIELLKYYKYVFRNVKYIIGPDYSMYGNFRDSTLIHQLEKEAVVCGWFLFEMGINVYPNVTYALESSFDYCFSNIYYGSNVALSLKGSIDGNINEELIIKAITKVVDTIFPKAIIVYSVSSLETTRKIMQYAIDRGVIVLIVDNTLGLRNLRRLKNNG